MCCDSINNVTECLWQSGHLQRVSRLLGRDEATKTVAAGLREAVQRGSLPGCTNKLIFFPSSRVCFLFAVSLARPINVNGSCRNRTLQEELVSSFLPVVFIPSC